MSEFIVLGLIPGTQLQITFLLWALLVAAGVIGSLIWLGHRRHAFRNWLIAIRIMLLMRQRIVAQ
jgi:hypothetical protein